MQRTEAQRLAGTLSGGGARPSAERLAPLIGIAVPLPGLAGLIVLEGPAIGRRWTLLQVPSSGTSANGAPSSGGASC
jgi:hypothetical protein